ncbi:MAG TPA: response regulator [Gemmatimonadaceae bacterium]|nr:response regulator [Gemmatimonadaceae bacterium]
MDRDFLKVLVVDDDTAVRSVIARMIRLDGHSVIEASNGVGGLRALDEQPVDLVVTDVVMPDMEGLEFLRRMRKRPQAPRVIAISGGGRAPAGNYLELALSLGADGVLAKPVSLEEIRSKIRQVMEPEQRPS